MAKRIILIDLNEEYRYGPALPLHTLQQEIQKRYCFQRFRMHATKASIMIHEAQGHLDFKKECEEMLSKIVRELDLLKDMGAKKTKNEIKEERAGL